MSRSGGTLFSGHSRRDIVSAKECFSGFFLSESHQVVSAKFCLDLEGMSDSSLKKIPASILYRL